MVLAFYLAVSLLLFGNQNFDAELRIRTTIELVNEKTIFLRSDTLRPRLVAENNFIHGEATNPELTEPDDLEAEVANDDDNL